MPSILEEKDAIRELQARYCFYFDGAQFERWLELWASDGVFDVGDMGRFAGHAQLRAFWQTIALVDGSPMVRHCVMNSIVEVAGNQATAQCYVVVLHGGALVGVGLAGRYQDRLVKAAGQWRFQERRVFFDLMPAG